MIHLKKLRQKKIEIKISKERHSKQKLNIFNNLSTNSELMLKEQAWYNLE
jgi:hypothetical protein